MRPLLAHAYEPHRVTYPCWVQPKLNGIRALYQNGHFQSRDELPYTPGLLQHIAEPLFRALSDNPELILDGELYVHGWPLQRINGAVTPNRLEPNADTVQVQYHIFDMVNHQATFKRRSERLTELSGLFTPLDPIQFVTTRRADCEDHANQYYCWFVSEGYEGMMYRVGDCPYTRPKQHWAESGPLWNLNPRPRGNFLSDKKNRCWHLLKRKDWQDDEFECIGVKEGEGKRQGMVGAFLCNNKSNLSEHVFSVGSFLGFSDSDLTNLLHSPPIGRRLKIKYLCLSSAGIPLNPTLLAIL